MSDYVWQPVENQEDAIAAAMQHILRWDKLPADAALCRRVPASAGGPEMVAYALRIATEHYRDGIDASHCELCRNAVDESNAALAWLDAQPQTGQE